MIQIESTLEGKRFRLHKLEQALKPKGYVIGGNWDYESGSFDYKMADDGGYQFLRLPFTAAEGQLDSDGAVVRLGTPYVLSHVYQRGLDDFAGSGALSGSFNQFSEPQDPDGQIKEKYVLMAKERVRELEALLSR